MPTLGLFSLSRAPTFGYHGSLKAQGLKYGGFFLPQNSKGYGNMNDIRDDVVESLKLMAAFSVLRFSS